MCGKLNREQLQSNREGALTSELCIFLCHRVQHCVSGNVWKLNRELLLSHREGALTSELCIFVCHHVQHCVIGNVWEAEQRAPPEPP